MNKELKPTMLAGLGLAFGIFLAVGFTYGDLTSAQSPPDSVIFLATLSLIITFAIIALGNTSLRSFLSSSLTRKLTQNFSEEDQEIEQLVAPQFSEIFVPQIVDGAFVRRTDLSQLLGAITGRAINLLPIDGIEVILSDNYSGLQFFAYQMGVTNRGKSENVYELPLSFSGRLIGNVCFSLPKGKIMQNQEQELAKLITLQISVLFSNVEYSSELSRMQQSADESTKAKTGFLANLSHEVRAPLAVILNALELVVDGLCGEISSDQKRILGLAKKSSDHLLELINDVLDYAKIEAGKLSPQKKSIDLAELLKDLSNIIRLQAESKKIKVEWVEHSEVLAVMADRKHLRQILINLLTNAVKYTPDGGEVTIWAERSPGQQIKICVKDSGVGIEPSHRDQVFAPFERLNNSYSRQQAGVGLGLSLAKRLAELNGGQLDFDSKPGQGSTFWLNLKSSHIDELDKQKNPEISRNDLRVQNIPLIIIDRDADHLSIICPYLSDLGYHITAYPTFENARQDLEAGHTRIVVMDNSELDTGDEAIGNSVADLVQRKNLHVLLLSSRAFIFDLEKYLRLGVERCLPKPAPLKELATICRGLVDSLDTQIQTAKIPPSSKSNLLH